MSDGFDVRVIGIGNAFRRDDGVGLRVVEEIRRVDPSVTALERDGEPTRLLDAWEGADAIVVVDALRSGAAPGTIRVFAAGDERATLPPAANTSSHGAGVAEAIALGRALGRLPRVVVCGVEVADLGQGPGLSPAVADTVGEAAGRVLSELRRLRAGAAECA